MVNLWNCVDLFWVLKYQYLKKLHLRRFFMCCSTKYPYPSQGRFFGLNPPTPLKNSNWTPLIFFGFLDLVVHPGGLGIERELCVVFVRGACRFDKICIDVLTFRWFHLW